MLHPAAARPSAHPTRWPIAVGLLVVTAVVIGTLVDPSAWASSPPADHLDRVARGAPGQAPTRDDGGATKDDGTLPAGVTVTDAAYPGIARLDPGLGGALREAARAAADDGVALHVNSGWRSPQYQDQLLRAAVAAYGSEREAARWVATADTSPHVTGLAVDIGPGEAAAWLAAHGAAFGLCQVYRNEPWHFELRPEAVDRRCPRMYADPTHDPRMRR